MEMWESTLCKVCVSCIVVCMWDWENYVLKLLCLFQCGCSIPGCVTVYCLIKSGFHSLIVSIILLTWQTMKWDSGN